jgi:hypothetical protein
VAGFPEGGLARNQVSALLDHAAEDPVSADRYFYGATSCCAVRRFPAGSSYSFRELVNESAPVARTRYQGDGRCLPLSTGGEHGRSAVDT